VSDQHNPSLSLDGLDIKRCVSNMVAGRLGENTLEPAATLGSLRWIFSPELELVIATNGSKSLS